MPGLFPFRDEQCPDRGPGLTHVQNGSPKCVHCDSLVIARPIAVEFGVSLPEDPLEPGYHLTGPVGPVDGPGRGELSERTKHKLEFVGWRQKQRGE